MYKTTVKYKDILKLSLPIIAGSAIENLTIIIDTAFLGRIGAIALGASALGGIFYLAFVMIGFGFGIGTQIIVARRFGEKKLSEIGQTLHHAALFLLPLAILLISFVLIWGNSIFKTFINSEEVLKNVEIFVAYRIWGLLFSYINILFKSFYIGIFKTKVVGISSSIIAFINIVLDYALIFGHWGFPEMGIAGAGLASVIAEGFGTIFFIIYTLSRKEIGEFGISKKIHFDGSLLGRIFKVASPLMAQFTLSFSGWFIFFIMVEHMGEIPLAVSNLVRTVYMIVLLPLWGYASATNTLVSYKLGDGKAFEIGAIVRKILKLSIGSMFILMCFVLFFYKQYLSLFTPDAEIIKACFPVLIVVSISSFTLAVGIIMYNIVSGAGKTMVTLLIESIVMTIYVLWSFSSVYVFNGTTATVWIAEIWYGCAMAGMSVIYLKFGNWRKGNV